MPALNARLHIRDVPAHSTAYLVQRTSTEILTVTGAWCFLSLLIVGLRVYVRAFKVKVFGLDDWATVATASLGLGIWICFVGECHWALGRHYEAIILPSLEMFLRWQFVHSLFSLLGIMLVKISVSLFLLRLAVKRSYQIALRSIIGKIEPPTGRGDPANLRNRLHDCLHSHMFLLSGVFLPSDICKLGSSCHEPCKVFVSEGLGWTWSIQQRYVNTIVIQRTCGTERVQYSAWSQTLPSRLFQFRSSSGSNSTFAPSLHSPSCLAWDSGQFFTSLRSSVAY